MLSYGVVGSTLELAVELLTLEWGLRAEVGAVLVRATPHLVVRMGDFTV